MLAQHAHVRYADLCRLHDGPLQGREPRRPVRDVQGVHVHGAHDDADEQQYGLLDVFLEVRFLFDKHFFGKTIIHKLDGTLLAWGGFEMHVRR